MCKLVRSVVHSSHICRILQDCHLCCSVLAATQLNLICPGWLDDTVIVQHDAATYTSYLTESCYAGEVLEEDSLEIQQAVSHIAEVALLGVGDANRMFPESLEELYDSYGGEEMEFRVIL